MSTTSLVVVACLLAVLPALRLLRIIDWTWTAAFAPAWAAFLIVTWSQLTITLLGLSRFALIVAAPAAAAFLAFGVHLVDGLDDDEPPLPPASDFRDRVLRLVDDHDAVL
jgi:hypothetical protein